MTDRTRSDTEPTTTPTIARQPVAEISTRLILELADQTDTRPTSLPPLYETIDPDALDRLVAHGGDGLEITFEYADCRLRVRGDGSFEIERAETW